MLDELDVFDDVEPRGAALNMAIDEALLESSSAPALRFYRWRRPAISFGYFGVYADATRAGPGLEIVRRWTGGGLVYHRKDLTYSMIIPASHPYFGRGSIEIYAAIHDAIRSTLNADGSDASLATSEGPKISEHCFAVPVPADVIADGKKIAGAAHRRTRAGLLHQGSIQYNKLRENFAHQFAKTICVTPRYQTLTAESIDRAEKIAAEKYSTAKWLKRR